MVRGGYIKERVVIGSEFCPFLTLNVDTMKDFSYETHDMRNGSHGNGKLGTSLF